MRELLETMLPNSYRLKKYNLKREIKMIKNEIED